MSDVTRDMLNALYGPLAHRAEALIAALKKQHVEFQITYGFFNGHYHKNLKGAYREDKYPIPVISVIDVCDIEMDFDGITVTTKLLKDQLLSLDLNEMCSFYYEVYGVHDYLSDYGNRNAVMEIRNNLLSSKDESFFISFSLPDNLKTQDIVLFVSMLKIKEFFY